MVFLEILKLSQLLCNVSPLYYSTHKSLSGPYPEPVQIATHNNFKIYFNVVT
jgi:hypothetical protein